MERQIGEIFSFERKKFEVIEGGCEYCAFEGEFCGTIEYDDLGDCDISTRRDGKSVCFKLIE